MISGTRMLSVNVGICVMTVIAVQYALFSSMVSGGTIHHIKDSMD